MKLPVYKLDINEFDEESGIEFISLVESPAVQKDFVAFNQEFVQPNPNEDESSFMQRCIKYVIDEGKETEQAVAICSSMWKQHFSEGEKVSFDFDDTLSTERGQQLAIKEINDGSIVYIISARNDASGMFEVADKLGIPHSRIYATGSNSAKVEKIKELGIVKHYDNNADVIAELGTIGIKFNLFNFSITNEEKRIVSGVAMVADLPIYRRDNVRGEYYVMFDANAIFKLAKKWARTNRYSAVNQHHESAVDGVHLLESYIIDRDRGINPPIEFQTISDGSWMVSYLVDNDEVWAKVKSGEFKGFSVEGFFDFVDEETQLYNKIKDIVSQWDGK
jgi:hypothetical protein